MSAYIDFRKLKERVGIMQVVDRYNLGLTEKAGAFVGDCPVCGSGREDSTKFKVTPGDGQNADRWNCFGSCKGGNVIDLVAAIEGCKTSRAAVLIAEWFDVTDCALQGKSSTNRGRGKADAEREPKASSDGCTEADYTGEEDEECVEDDEFVWRGNPMLPFEGLKLDPEHERVGEFALLASRLDAGYCSKGMMQGRLAIPIHDHEADLVAYCGLALGESAPRMKFPPEGKYEPGLELYNLHRAMQSDLFETDGLLVVEDVMDAWVFIAAGKDNVVATMFGLPTLQQMLRLNMAAKLKPQITFVWPRPSEGLDKMVNATTSFAWTRQRFTDVPVRELEEEAIHSLLS